MSNMYLSTHMISGLILYACIRGIRTQHQVGLSWSGTMIPCAVPSCYQCYTNAYACYDCCNDYRLISFTRCSNGCRTMSYCSDCRLAFYLCSYCQAGYGINDNGYRCSPCVQSNCQLCGYNVSSCDVCRPGYGRNNSECVACGVGNPFCVTCSQLNVNWCTSCASGYIIQSNGGYNTYCQLMCSGNCFNCSITSTNCTSCYYGYYLDITSHVCQICSTGCATCFNFTSCTLCFSGYYYNTSSTLCSKTCQSICRTCETTNFDNCTSCYATHFLESTQNTCYACSSNCINCDSNISCATCKSGYDYNLTTFECQIICLFPCSTCQQVSTNCTSCQPMYFLQATENICYRCMQNCDQCSDNITCMVCSIGYSFNASALSCMFCPISNCSQCIYDTVSQQYQCLACFPGSQLKLNKVCTRPGCGSPVPTSYECNNELFVSWDGCDDQCYPVEDFNCTAPNSTSYISACSYNQNLTIKLANFSRIADENKIHVKFLIEPPLNIFRISSEQELKRVFNFQMTNTEVQTIRYNPNTSEIQIEGLMTGELTSGEIIFSFVPQSGWSPWYFASVQQTIVITIDINSVDVCYIHDFMSLRSMLLYGTYTLVGCGWFCCLIGFLIKRLHGIQTIFIIQVLFVCVLWIDSFSTLPLNLIASLKFSTGLNYPFFGFDSKSTSQAPFTHIFSLSSYFLTSNLNIMFILQIISLVAVIITYIKLHSFEKQHNIKQIIFKQAEEKLQKKNDKLNNNYQSAEQALLYSTLLNLIPLANFIVLFIKFGNSKDTGSWVCFLVALIFFILVFLRFWFYPDIFGYFRYSFRLSCLATRHYCIVILTLISITLLITLYNSVVYPAAIPALLSSIYTIGYQPYKDKGQNIRSLMNHICILLYIGYFLWLANTERVKDCQYYTPIILFVCMEAIVFMVSVFSLILGCYYYYYYNYVEPKEKQKQANEDKKAQNKLLNQLVVIDPVRQMRDVEQDLTMRQLVDPNLSLQAYTQQLNSAQIHQPKKYDPKISYYSLKNSSPTTKRITIDEPCAKSQADIEQHQHRKVSHKIINNIKMLQSQQMEADEVPHNSQKNSQKLNPRTLKSQAQQTLAPKQSINPAQLVKTPKNSQLPSIHKISPLKQQKQKQKQKEKQKQKQKEKEKQEQSGDGDRMQTIATRIIKQQNLQINATAAINYIAEDMKRHKIQDKHVEMDAYEGIGYH